MTLRALFTLVAVLAFSPPATAREALQAQAELTLGEPDPIRASGLTSGARYDLAVVQYDENGAAWCAEAPYLADSEGRIDTATLAPLAGDYAGFVDATGLFWSARSCPHPDAASSPSADFRQVRIELKRGAVTRAVLTQKVWLKAPDVAEEQVVNPIVASLLTPRGRPEAAIIVIGGSEGGNAWARRIAALLAHQGYAGLALAYIGKGDLPKVLAEIPIEVVERAAGLLHARYPGAKVVVLGYSRGAELALLAASHFPDIDAAIAISPSSVAFQSFQPPDFPLRSSWTYGGTAVPFLPYSPDERFRSTQDGYYLRLRSLEAPSAFTAAAIPAERTEGPILLISGASDRIWPSTLMAEQVRARLLRVDFAHPVTHLAYPRAGHMIFGPGYSPTTQTSRFGGGEPASNAAAQVDSWRSMLAFLQQVAGPAK